MPLNDIVKEIMILDDKKETKKQEIALITMKSKLLRGEIEKRFPNEGIIVEYLEKQKIKEKRSDER